METIGRIRREFLKGKTIKEIARCRIRTARGDRLRGWAYRARTGESVRALSV